MKIDIVIKDYNLNEKLRLSSYMRKFHINMFSNFRTGGKKNTTYYVEMTLTTGV